MIDLLLLESQPMVDNIHAGGFIDQEHQKFTNLPRIMKKIIAFFRKISSVWNI